MKKIIITVLVHILLVFAVFTVLLSGMWKCPFFQFTGIPCPACGCTRALLNLARLNLSGYLAYNAFAIPLIFALLTATHMNKLRNRKIPQIVIAITAVLNLVYYSLRIILTFGNA